MITDLNTIQALATTRHDEFEVLRYRLQLDDDLSDARIDAFVDALAAPIIAAIDCTQCAHCCRVLDVYVTPDAAARLPEARIEPAQDAGEWGKLRGKPCAFLRGKLCSVYDRRPDSCRRYPQFTPDFRWVLGDMIAGAGQCPIIYHVLDHISAAIDDLQQP